jgi:hypothetical protein
MALNDYRSLRDPTGAVSDESRSPTDLATGSRPDLRAADTLISDLAALVDAGLVVIQTRVLGPARYGIASEVWRASDASV